MKQMTCQMAGKFASAEYTALRRTLRVMETHERESSSSRSSDVDIFRITPSDGVLELDL